MEPEHSYIIKKIEDINKKEYHFIIPEYQRGYRWGKDETEYLIDDILDSGKQSYFIQPIVYRLEKDNNTYIVIDGQQRLTTIYLILKVLENKLPLYEIEYETRKETKEVLEDIDNIGMENTSTVDTFHISLVQKAIVNKILKFSDEQKENLKNGVLNTQFIFYEVSKEKETQFFKRINMGKIYLTDGELVKAFVLNRDLYSKDDISNKQKQLKWAVLWDEMEENLHDEDFLGMFNKKINDYPNTKIDFLLEIVARKIAKENEIEFDENKNYWIFKIFEQYNRQSKTDGILKIWNEIRSCFRTLKSWYDNNEIYHLIGYIMFFEANAISKTNDFLEKYNNNIKNKEDFIMELYKKIKENLEAITIKDGVRKIKLQFTKEVDTIEDFCNNLDYTNDKYAIQKILLLFNILTIIKNNTFEKNRNTQIKELKRFSFGNFINQKWDIEHIHARAEDKERENINEDTLKRFKKVLDEKNIKKLEMSLDNRLKESQTLKNENNNEIYSAVFNEIYEELIKKSGQKEVQKTESLANLTLLDSHTNSAYKNDVFILKRDRIIENDRNGEFIPICTKNVFFKYYSKNVNQVVCWSEEDGDEYIQEIVKTIKESKIYKKGENNNGK